MTTDPPKPPQSPINATLLLANTTPAAGAFYDDYLWTWRIGLFGMGGLVISCLGVLGNSISILVLAHFKKKGSAHILLISLSVFDTIYLITEAALENLSYISKGGLIDDSYREFIRPVYGNIYPAPHISNFCVSYIVVVITIERYVAVVWPFQAKMVGRSWIAAISVVTIVAVSLLYHTPLYLAYDYDYTWNNQTESEVFRFYRTEFGLSSFYNHIYFTWINLTTRFLVPFVILLVLNTQMMVSLRRSKMVKSKARENQDHRLTFMIVFMIVVFFFCSLFPAVAFILTTGLNSFTQCSHDCNRFSAVADLLRIVNSAINFVIYCALGQNFRDIFKKLFCSFCKKDGKVTGRR